MDLKRTELNALKIVMTVLAWFGSIWSMLGIYMFGRSVIDLIRLFPTRTDLGGMVIVDGPNFGWPIISGMLLALAAGIVARPRFLWPVLVVSGIAYSVLGFIKTFLDPLFPVRISTLLGYAFVGMVLVLGGLSIRWLRRRQNTRVV